MARKRSNASRRLRNSPGSERSYYEFLASTPTLPISRTELVRLIRGGEDTYLELKVRFSNVEKLTAEIIALANTGGGAIIFGVNDQLRIEGIDDPESVDAQLREICFSLIQPPVFPYINCVAFDNGRRIVVLEVFNEDRPHRTLDDRFYLREGSSKREATREELSRLYQEAFPGRFEQLPVFRSWIERDIDEATFWSYIRGVSPGTWGEGARGFPTETVLGEMGLAVKIGDEQIPTMAALLLFGANERVAEILPRAEFLLTRYSGADTSSPIVEHLHLRGNLLRLFDGAMNFIKRYVDLWDARPSRKSLVENDEKRLQNHEFDSALTLIKDQNQVTEYTIGRGNYARAAVIEALVNSIIHRNWGPSDRRARINIYDDSVEFINPAGLPELPAASLRYGVAVPPNPRLKSVFTNPHYGVHRGAGGIPALLAEATAFSRRTPEGPTLANNEFRLKLFGWR